MYSNLFNYENRIEGSGYKAPSTDKLNEETANLNMDEPYFVEEIFTDYVPKRINLKCHLDYIPCKSNATIEVIKNSQSMGQVKLYDVGYVKTGKSTKYKAHSKIQQVKFIYQGKGFYQNLEEKMVPFHEESWISKKLSHKILECLYTKPFGTHPQNVRLEQEVHHSRGNPEINVIGFGQNIYPRYPYGGYCPPRLNLSEMEQIFFTLDTEITDQDTETTSLFLEALSYYESMGFTPPETFLKEGKIIMFPEKLTPEEQMSVGQAIMEGFIKIKFTHLGQEYIYASCHYEQLGGMRDSAEIYFERTNS